jgi:hypothetical protein
MYDGLNYTTIMNLTKFDDELTVLILSEVNK